MVNPRTLQAQAMCNALQAEDDQLVAVAETLLFGKEAGPDGVKKLANMLRRRVFPQIDQTKSLEAEKVKEQFAGLEGVEIGIRATDEGGPKRLSQLGGSKVLRSARRRG
jgi:hypothetical protein